MFEVSTPPGSSRGTSKRGSVAEAGDGNTGCRATLGLARPCPYPNRVDETSCRPWATPTIDIIQGSPEITWKDESDIKEGSVHLAHRKQTPNSVSRGVRIGNAPLLDSLAFSPPGLVSRRVDVSGPLSHSGGSPPSRCVCSFGRSVGGQVVACARSNHGGGGRFLVPGQAHEVLNKLDQFNERPALAVHVCVCVLGSCEG